MDYKIIIKKLGKQWYVDIEHNDPINIQLDSKINKTLNVLDKNKDGVLNLYFTETHSVLFENVLYFNDEDIMKYFMTNETFPIRFIYYDREYSISSDLYYLLEYFYNFNFHKNLYNLEISNITI